MKHSLNRIEPNAHRLEPARTTAKPQPVVAKITYSFEIRRTAQKQNAAEQMTDGSPNLNSSEGTSCPDHASLQTSSGKHSSGKVILPQFNFKSYSYHALAANSSLEIIQAQENQIDVAACEAQLRRIVHQIENLYIEGPIVDGWLESYNPAPESTAATLLHNSLDRQIDNKEEVSGFELKTAINGLSGVSYCLCGLDAANQKWSYPCPPEQLASVSVAIARYHKLRQLLKQKQYLETHLKQMISDKC